MKFRTQIAADKAPFDIDHSRPVVLLGSCFADEMAAPMIEGGFEICSNPMGTLYNPASVAHAIIRIADGTPYTSDDLSERNGTWFSFDHNTRFSAENPDELICRINETLTEASQKLRMASTLIVTLGTARAWRLRNGLRIVANCHKLPQAEFEHVTITQQQTVALMRHALRFARAHNPSLNVVLTVSPVRYTSYGLHGSQLDKATLLTATDTLCSDASEAFYFPAYEALVDDLRDYRFYADDLVHPSPMAVRYVYELFEQAFYSAETVAKAHENARNYKRLAHRPIQNLSGK